MLITVFMLGAAFGMSFLSLIDLAWFVWKHRKFAAPMLYDITVHTGIIVFTVGKVIGGDL